MANLSDASGKIILTLRGSREDMTKAWGIIRRFWGDGEYGASYADIGADDVQMQGKDAYAESGFSGCGRWSFANNIESFGRWIDTSTAVTEDEKDFLRNMDFRIGYDFADYEPGCGVFYSARMQNRHEKGQPLSTISGETLDEEALEISARNLARYIGYDDYEVADMSMPRSELKEWFLQGATKAEKAKIEAVFDNDEAYRQLMQDERGTIFWSYDDNIDWGAYIDEFCKDEKESEKITIRKVDSPDKANDGFVYGAFNSHGTPVGKRFRTAEECRKSFEEQGFRNIVMPQKSDRER